MNSRPKKNSGHSDGSSDGQEEVKRVKSPNFERGLMSRRKISEGGKSSENVSVKRKERPSKKVLYVEIDDEVTSIYERLKSLRVKSVYLVVPKRSILFQSIVNLKILKLKAQELEKNIFIITNDQNGLHLAGKIGLPVYDKVEGHEHPSLVSGKFMEDQQSITPLKASINSLEEQAPTRRKERKFSITDLVRGPQKGRRRNPLSFLSQKLRRKQPFLEGLDRSSKKKGGEGRGKLVLITPNRHALVTLIIFSVLILLTITYIALPGATIALTPKSNVLETSVNVTLADIELNRAELDTHPFHMIPSYTVTKKIQKTFTYQATGKEFQGTNARGKITIKNVSENAWPLIARTRFQTGDGLVYRIDGPVTVPAVQDDGQPGTLVAEVVADEFDAYEKPIGERGNIGPSIFFLPGLSEENQQKISAESTEPFTGGTTSVVLHISAEDIEAARSKMVSDLQASAEAELSAYVQERNEAQKTSLELLKGGNVIGSGALQMSEPVVIVPPNLEGQKLESFDVQGEIVVSGMAYNRDELTSILKTELTLKKNPQKRLYRINENSLSYRIVESDSNSRKVKITATIQGIEEYEISPEKENGERLIKKIKDHILNKEIEEARTYIQNLPEIDKVVIESWPAWAPTLPGIPDNIQVEIRRAE